MKFPWVSLFALALLLARVLPGFAAEPAPAATELEVSDAAVSAAPAVLTLDTIMEMPQVSFSGVDPWDRKRHAYTGTLLLPLLEKLGLRRDAKSLDLSARNDYRVSIRMEDLRAHRYLIAYRLDGWLIRDRAELKKRGPLMIAIDFEGSPGLDPEVYKSQLVWQLNQIIVR